MALKDKYLYKREDILRDSRPLVMRMAEALRKPGSSVTLFCLAAFAIWYDPTVAMFADLIFFFMVLYFVWLIRTDKSLPFKMPQTAKCKDKNQRKPTGGYGMAEGILYLGNDNDTGEEIWFGNSDARTHILYLGTTGSGKTEGLKALSSNALSWGSGFVYIDGKADTDLWSGLSSLARRFGRDDDLLVMNYMTGNSEVRAASNTLNPFSSGSASYLTNMLTSLMPDAEGDNAMWKERAVALVSSMMPLLVWKRDNQNVPLSVSVVRQYLGFSDVIRASRDEAVPETLRVGLKAYLTELPGYVDDAFDDNGQEKPMPPDAPMVDTSVPRQQHGYLSMQFTRSLQSLGDDYGYIFDTQAADVDMMDVVLNRRILVTLIPALEKSSDETANLGKIIASTLKGMMGATLGHTVEGDTATAIENKPTNSRTPFMAIFDEVGYYTAAGMAVMAAQARSLGFSLIYAAQDLPALEKRVKEEARSITANCNIKLFGKLEDPTQTKDFFEKTVGMAMVTEVSGFTADPGSMSRSYGDSHQASVQQRARADYDELRAFTEGRAICAFGERVAEVQIFYANPGHAKAMRVQRFLPIPPPNEEVLQSMRAVNGILTRLRDPSWSPEKAAPPAEISRELDALASGFAMGVDGDADYMECGALAVAAVADSKGLIKDEDVAEVVPAASETPAGDQAPAVSPDTVPSDTAASAPTSEMPSMAEAPGTQAAPPSDGPISWDNITGGDTGAGDTGAGDTGAGDTGASDISAGQATDTQSEVPDVTPVLGDGTHISDSAAPSSQSDASGPITWDSLIAESGGNQSETPAPASETTEEAVVPEPGAPMSWTDIMGGGDAGQNSPEATASAKPETPFDLPAEESVSAPSAEQTGPETTEDTGAEPGGPMSWTDIMGGGSDGGSDAGASDAPAHPADAPPSDISAAIPPSDVPLEPMAEETPAPPPQQQPGDAEATPPAAPAQDDPGVAKSSGMTWEDVINTLPDQGPLEEMLGTTSSDGDVDAAE